jgi:hypothetical protein
MLDRIESLGDKVPQPRDRLPRALRARHRALGDARVLITPSDGILSEVTDEAIALVDPNVTIGITL